MNFKTISLLSIHLFFAYETAFAKLPAKVTYLLNQPYELLFGKQDISQDLRNTVRQALIDNGIANPDSVPVKQMNQRASKLIGNELVSFTLFGMWFNEDFLNQEEPAFKEWVIYHEAAHYALNHHAKALAVGGFFGLLLAGQLYNFSFQHKALNALCVAFTGFISYEALKSAVRIQELQADIEATRVLCLVDKKDTIAAYLKMLKEGMLSDSHDDEWHYSLADQYTVINYYYQLYK